MKFCCLINKHPIEHVKSSVIAACGYDKQKFAILGYDDDCWKELSWKKLKKKFRVMKAGVGILFLKN